MSTIKAKVMTKMIMLIPELCISFLSRDHDDTDENNNDVNGDNDDDDDDDEKVAENDVLHW